MPRDSAPLELTYKDAAGKRGIELLFRDREPQLEIVESGRPWSFDSDGRLFRLVSEAQRINIGHLFDPVLARRLWPASSLKSCSSAAISHRCLVVCPGNLVEQWQDELFQRFQLPFEILTNDKLEAARAGNWFAENPLAICRLDKLSRNEDVQSQAGCYRLGSYHLR